MGNLSLGLSVHQARCRAASDQFPIGDTLVGDETYCEAEDTVRR
jgi:hypothetical protein